MRELLVEGLNLSILRGMPICESTLLELPDVQSRKYGEQIGLDTLVVHTANYECYNRIYKKLEKGFLPWQ